MIHYNKAIPAQEIKLLIFDLDGTLVDSRADLANSINAMLRDCNRVELPADLIASYIGDGAPTLVRRALGDPDDESIIDRALEFFLGYYREHKLDNTYVYEGMKEALIALAQRSSPGCETPRRKLAILSNKPVAPSRQIAEALGLSQFVSQIYGGNSFHTKKPDPAGALTLLAEHGCQSHEAMIIGDSDIDILTARNAGMWSCGVSYGFAPHSLQAAEPDVIIDHPRELAEIFQVEAFAGRPETQPLQTTSHAGGQPRRRKDRPE